MTELLELVRGVLDIELFMIGGTPVTVATLGIASAALILTVLVARALRRVVERTLEARGVKRGHAAAISALLRYPILVLGFGIALDTAGIELTTLFTAGALFAVGLGFAMQSIAQNFVAGIILLSERSITPGDVLEVEGTIVRIMDMGLRASVGRSRDGEDLVIPNGVLIQTTVINHTLSDASYRIKVPVGVTYSSDMAIVRETLEQVARTVSEQYAVPNTTPQVVLVEFGNNAVNWEVAIWMNDPWTVRLAKSALHEAIWWAFKERGIVIAFPQLDVHFDPPVAAGFASPATAAG
jgi:small-conductance mechanosensitive channel